MNGAAIAVLVSFAASSIPAFRVCMRMLELRAGVLLPRLLPLVIASAFMSAAMVAILRLPLPSAALLGVGLLAGGAVYAAAVFILARPLLSSMWAGLRPGY